MQPTKPMSWAAVTLLLFIGLAAAFLAMLKGWAIFTTLPVVLILMPIAIIIFVSSFNKNSGLAKTIAGLSVAGIFLFSFCALSVGDTDDVFAFTFIRAHSDSFLADSSNAISLASLLVTLICFAIYPFVRGKRA